MRKTKFLIIALLLTLTLAVPTMAMADKSYGPGYDTTEEADEEINEEIIIELNIPENEYEAAIAQFESGEIEPTTKYTTTNVNIRKEPNTDSEILDTSNVNTSFEVIAVIDGWAIITTSDGYAYMKADWFSDEPVEVKTYSDDDLRILAMILCGECQTAPDEEQRLVGSVFLNRVASSQFPNTFLGVAEDRRWGIQYACWYDGNAFRTIQDSNWRNAQWLLENGSILPANVLYQSQRPIGTIYLKTKYHYYCY